MADSSGNQEEEHKNRPKATKLRQQKLPAWQPILTSTTVIPAIVVIGIIFLPIGVGLYLYSESVAEREIDYTNCLVYPTTDKKIFAWELLNKTDRGSAEPIKCRIQFNLTENFEGDVYFYYALDNFYQNHRRYVKSRSDSQLMGDLMNVQDCDPYSYQNQTDNKSPVVAPCGAVANSMFNDSFYLVRTLGENQPPVPVPFTYEGIIWDTDRSQKFKNPPTDKDKSLCDAFKNTVKPPNWAKAPCELDVNDATNNGFENVDFIVWMRTAALPNFRKLYRKLDRAEVNHFPNGLPSASYELEIEYNYPVTRFHGKKRFIISTTSWMGSKNSFLGIAYMVVGVCCIGLGIVFLGIHVKFGKSYA